MGTVESDSLQTIYYSWLVILNILWTLMQTVNMFIEFQNL